MESFEKGQHLFECAEEISRADLVRYAGASGDLNPIHWNEEFARSVGLPDVIAHGMLTMGLAMQAVSDWAPQGAQVVDVQTRFAKPVVVPNRFSATVEPSTTVTIVGAVGAVDAQAGTLRVDLTVTAPDVTQEEAAALKVLVKAQALVRLGGDSAVAD